MFDSDWRLPGVRDGEWRLIVKRDRGTLGLMVL